MDERMNGRIDGCVNGWMNEWIVAWMDDGYIDSVLMNFVPYLVFCGELKMTIF